MTELRDFDIEQRGTMTADAIRLVLSVQSVRMVQLLALGYSQYQIADMFDLGRSTITHKLRRARWALRLDSNAELVQLFRDRGMVDERTQVLRR